MISGNTPTHKLDYATLLFTLFDLASKISFFLLVNKHVWAVEVIMGCNHCTIFQLQNKRVQSQEAIGSSVGVFYRGESRPSCSGLTPHLICPLALGDPTWSCRPQPSSSCTHGGVKGGWSLEQRLSKRRD